jgi:Tol biopolymer transport system component
MGASGVAADRSCGRVNRMRPPLTALVFAGLLVIGANCSSSEGSLPADPPQAPVGHIVFMSSGQDDTQTFFIANADGSDQRQLTAPGEYCCMLRISPDRSRLLVMPGGALSPPITGGTLSIDGTDFEMLHPTDPTLNLAPQAWSPDGSSIAFEGWDDEDPSRTGVYTARASDLGGLVRVTDAPGLPHDTPLDYSPDGTQLVFYRSIRAEPHFPIDIGGSLWVVNVDGSNAHRLDTGGVSPWWWARWSPDGATILFPTERLQPGGALWTIGPDGSDLTKVFEDEEGRFASVPTWSPDGSQILFALNPTNDSFVHNANWLYVVDADGSGLTLVIGGPGFKGSPEWWL